MSKAIRWQVPFVSLQNVHYRVDIYDEQDGSWSGITELLAGETPFVTDEDNSDDFFCPVRTQTGTLQVCTLKPDGTYITLDELLPANNIARPVRLINTDSNNAIEWQGFLSCEAYSQDYTGIPQNLDIPVISVLEAMASVEVDPAKLSGLNTVGGTINQLLEIFIDKAGVSYFSEYYVPTIARGRNIVSKYIDATILFEQKEYNNENSTTYIVSGLSLQDCLARIATYMGWCLREKSGTLYFMAANETVSYNRRYRLAWIDMQGNASYRWMVDLSDTAVSTQDIDDLDWMGNGHQRSVAQGAKSVEVVANLEKYTMDMVLPEFPYGITEEQYINLLTVPDVWQYLLASLNTAPYQNIALRYYKATVSMVYLTQTTATESSIADTLSHRFNAEGIVDLNSGHGTETVYAGAFFAKVSYDSQQQASHNTQDGLYAVWLQRVPESQGFDYNTQPMFSMTSMLLYNLTGGYLNLSTSMKHIIVNYADDYETVWKSINDQWEDKILMHIKIGDKYWNGSTWTLAESKVWVDIDGSNFKKNWVPSMPVEETDGYLIPLDNNSGAVEIAIYPQNTPTRRGAFLCETFFSQLSVGYIDLDNDALTDRSANHYYRLLGTNFRDEISVGTDLASTLNNQPSPSLIMNSETEAMTELNYGTNQVPDMRRPEVDLLNRLATYYSAARQRLSLIVKHPTAAPLPLLRLNGISPDTRKYLPLAESRDWINDTSTLTCFETP